jgi:spore germination cell wall hydrolase CwlJ-like protein
MNFLDSAMAVLVSISTNPTLPDEYGIETIKDPQLACMTQNIYHEARNESTAGWIAVADVTMNRVKSDAFPNTICEVVYESPHYRSQNDGKLYPYKNRCQFSWYCDGKSDKIKNIKKYKQIYEVAKMTYKNQLDITDGALFYHADYVKPRWAETMNVTTRIDTHIFYKPKK